MARTHRLELVLSDSELQEVDEQRGNIPRAVYVRSLIHGAPEVKDVASYDEALAILTAMARDGKVSAASDLEKALRNRPDRARSPSDELDRLLSGGN